MPDWTLDSGLWTLDFSLLKLYRPPKNLYMSPQKNLPPQKISSPK